MDEDAIDEIYEADCIVGVKWGRHKHGVEKGENQSTSSKLDGRAVGRVKTHGNP